MGAPRGGTCARPGGPRGRRRRSLSPLLGRIARSLLVGALGTLLGAAGPSAAFAQGGAPSAADEAAAESLFEAGRALMAEGRVAEACPKFEESNRIAPSAGTTLNLAKCFEAQGKTASAWAAYKRAIGLARATGQTRHVAAAEQFLSDIAPKLSRLVIEAPDAPPGLVIRRGGVALGAASLGVEIAVDPGEHVVEATAPGRRPFRATADVAPDGARVVVVVPALEPEPAAPVAAPPPPPPAPPPEPPASPLLVAGIVVGGVGVLALGVGVTFGVMTLSDAAAAEEDPTLCPGRRCTAAGQAAIDDAETKAWVSNVGVGLGAAAILGGGAMVAWSLLEDEPAATGARIRPFAGPGGAGVVVGGAL